MSDISYNQDLEERIELYLKNRLPDEEIDLLWAELVQNPYYFDYLKSAANLKEILSETNQTATVTQIPGTFRRYKRYWMAVAASLALLIGVISVVLNSGSPNNTGVQALQTLALRNVRSAQVKNDTPSSRIQQAIGLVNEGKIDQAMTIFKSLTNLKNNPSIGATAYIDMGIIHYNRKAFHQALDDFNFAISKAGGDNPLLKEKAYWYTGNTYLKMGRKYEARSAIQKAYNLNGAYRRIAGKYLNELNQELN